MPILRVVAIIENALFSIHWSECEEHSLSEMAVKLTDVGYLTDYFDKYPLGLKYYMTGELDAILKTKREAGILIDELYKISENSLEDIEPDLDELFEPLHRNEGYQNPGFYRDYKAKGYDAPWVRIYAIKLGSNLYVITGFGIKLVKQMKEDPLLLKELKKLQQASEFLRTEGFLN